MDDKFKEVLVERYRSACEEREKLGEPISKPVDASEENILQLCKYMKACGRVESIEWVAEQLGVKLK